MPDTFDILPKDTHPAIRVLAMPADTNALGDIFGGWLMSQVDIAGSVTAYEKAKGRVVTVAVNQFQFIKPVYVGDLVSLYSEVSSIGNTSITIKVTAFAERDRNIHECQRVAEAELTYVATDENRNPRSIKE